MLDAEPLPAGAPPARLHFVADEETAVIAHDFLNDLEILFRRCDESADALNWFGDETGNAAAGAAANHLLHVLRAAHAATRVLETERAAIAVGVVRVHDSRLRAVPAATRPDQ
jgi:hypothetical protein